MGIGKKILELAPVAVGFAAAVGLIESGAASDISEMIAANMDYIRPTLEAAETALVFLGTYYLAKKQCEYLAADRNYDPDI
jgi:hypothetical protein